ncbi:MAG: hypothetical protein LAP21_20510 [Acidobacteriia bacterium]|nr:hypothetical protein [Terriglobia bacterium]
MNLALVIDNKSLPALLLPAVLAVAVFILAFLLARRRKSQPPPSLKNAAPPQKSVVRIRIENPVSDSDPCFLLLGSSDSGKTTLLSGLHHRFTARDRQWIADLAGGVARWEFTGAEILEVAGDLVLSGANGDPGQIAWKRFLTHLQKHRPHRPLDGMVLVVAGAELAGERPLAPEELQRQATRISGSLKLLREQLGFCLPLYVVVSGCDAIPGFRAFADGPLQAHRNEIFGWSNPYNLDAPFDPRWTGEAFSEVQSVLSHWRAEFFLRRQTASAAAASGLHEDELFLFPARLQEMQAPLAAWLEQLLRDSGHRDALQLRGIYFSGRTTGANAEFEEIRPEKEHAHGSYFSTELFERKIFPERGLARPLDTAFAHRSTEVLVARWLSVAAALLLFPGMLLSWYRLSQSADTIAHNLDIVSSTLHQQKDADANTAYKTIYAAQGLSGGNFQSVFLPASLASPLEQQVRATMPKVFTRIVYPGLRSEMEQRIAKLLSDPPQLTDKDQNPVGPDASQRLSSFTATLVDLENNIVRYNKLAPEKQGNGQDMLTLATALSPQAFAGLSTRDTSSLDAIVPASWGNSINGSAYYEKTQQRLEALVADVLRQRMNEVQLRMDLDALIARIKLLEENELKTYEQLDNMRQLLSKVQSQLAAPGLQWIALSEDQFHLPDDLSKSLDSLSRPPEQNVLLCGPESEDKSCTALQQLKTFIDQMARQHATEFRSYLLDASTRITGKMIAAADSKLKYSEGTSSLQSVLDNFLKLPFVAHEGTRELQEVEAGEQLFWDNDRLQAAIQDKQAYDKFFGSDLANADSALQNAFEEVALTRLEANMIDSIASAQQFPRLQPPSSGDKIDQATINEVRGFQAASKSLDEILSEFGELNFDEGSQNLLRVITGHALMVLGRIDGSFESRGFYLPITGNFNHWEGTSLPSEAGYGIKNEDDMAAYLVAQRQDVQAFTNAAQPLVAFLQEHPPANHKPARQILKWQGIVGDLQKYTAAPGSSGLGSLEAFMANGMDKVAPTECMAPTPAAGVTTTGVTTPYFIQVQRSVEHLLILRCRSLSEKPTFQQYNRIADFFNQHLAGRFPFSSPPADDSAEEAAPGDVVELFHRLDADEKSIRQGLQSSASGPNTTKDAKAFLDQMDALRPLFVALLAQPGQMPAFDFAPAFRVNRRHEKNGNQIIDWTLQVGDSTFRNSDAPSTGHWDYEQPVKLLLRWAKDSPEQPVPIAPAYGKADTRTVIFEFHDPWALLTMLKRHAAAPDDFDRSVDPDPNTLVFTAGQESSPPPAGRQKVTPPARTTGEPAKVFVRLRIYAPGKTESLLVPAFPFKAPVLPSVGN